MNRKEIGLSDKDWFSLYTSNSGCCLHGLKLGDREDLILEKLGNSIEISPMIGQIFGMYFVEIEG